MGKSHLVSAVDPQNNFLSEFLVCTHENPSSYKFVNISPTVIRNRDYPGVPDSSGYGLLMWGSGEYRKIDIFLAWAPLTPEQRPPAPPSWRFWTGSGDQWSNPGDMHLAAPIFAAPSEAEPPYSPPLPPTPEQLAAPWKAPQQWRTAGELSVTWLPAFHRWLLLYNRSPWPLRIVARIARDPWGPWSEERIVFRLDDSSCNASMDDHPFMRWTGNIVGEGGPSWTDDEDVYHGGTRTGHTR